MSDSLLEKYQEVRQTSIDICRPLEIEDYLIQPMDDASPPKWHLAHVSWFFETFLLKPHLPDYRIFHPSFEFLFNSYYNGVGKQFPRQKRGHLSRPTVAEVMSYRRHVDDAMQRLLSSNAELSEEIKLRVNLGLNHEQQHQELLFTDLKYNLGNNPLFPEYHSISKTSDQLHNSSIPNLSYFDIDRGIYEIGVTDSESFVFDNETPRHEVLVRDCRIANRLVTNGEYLAFIEDGAYERFDLWLSDAWSLVNSPTGFKQPLYWHFDNGEWFEYTLHGLEPLDLNKPVCHISAYEADAFARWSGARLPTEAEWEIASTGLALEGNLATSGKFHPSAINSTSKKPQQMFGDVWEWTSSSYSAYPGFTPFPGQLGEYNGKFMANQLVLRGGSCVTPKNHIRNTYRNFFYPKDRWQFSGIRLVLD